MDLLKELLKKILLIRKILKYSIQMFLDLSIVLFLNFSVFYVFIEQFTYDISLSKIVENTNN